MTKRSFKYLLLAGLVAGMTAGSARAESVLSYSSDAVDTLRGVEYFMEAYKELSDPSHLSLVPVIDITSTPAHAVVGIEQKLIRKRTLVEDDRKDDIRRRLSLRKKRELTTEVSQEDKGGESKEDPKVVDGKLSKIEIKTSEATGKAEGGLVGEGTDKEITEDGKTSTTDIAKKQREGYLSSAGSLSDQEKYQLERKYREQEEAIRILALAATLRKSMDDKLIPLMDTAEEHYNKTNAKKDLDPKNKEGVVRSEQFEEADQNQMLRDYAYFSVIYDELLSLEQQVMGLRLQARGGLSEQKTDPVIEIDYTDNK